MRARDRAFDYSVMKKVMDGLGFDKNPDYKLVYVYCSSLGPALAGSAGHSFRTRFLLESPIKPLVSAPPHLLVPGALCEKVAVALNLQCFIRGII